MTRQYSSLRGYNVTVLSFIPLFLCNFVRISSFIFMLNDIIIEDKSEEEEDIIIEV